MRRTWARSRSAASRGGCGRARLPRGNAWITRMREARAEQQRQRHHQRGDQAPSRARSAARSRAARPWWRSPGCRGAAGRSAAVAPRRPAPGPPRRRDGPSCRGTASPPARVRGGVELVTDGGRERRRHLARGRLALSEQLRLRGGAPSGGARGPGEHVRAPWRHRRRVEAHGDAHLVLLVHARQLGLAQDLGDATGQRLARGIDRALPASGAPASRPPWPRDSRPPPRRAPAPARR